MNQPNLTTPPSWLDKHAREYYRKIAEVLEAKGTLNNASRELLASASKAYSVYRQAEAKLDEQGRVVIAQSGAEKVSPWCQVSRSAFDVVVKVYKELQISQGEAIPTNDDELDQFLAKQKRGNA